MAALHELGLDLVEQPFAAHDTDTHQALVATATLRVALDEGVRTTEEAMSTDNLIIASLYIQDVGFDSFNGASAQLINRFIGSIVGASLTDETVQWTVNPAINKLKSQVPTRKITADMLLRQIGS